jgi:hypothetical protein
MRLDRVAGQMPEAEELVVIREALDALEARLRPDRTA